MFKTGSDKIPPIKHICLEIPSSTRLEGPHTDSAQHLTFLHMWKCSEPFITLKQSSIKLMKYWKHFLNKWCELGQESVHSKSDTNLIHRVVENVLFQKSIANGSEDF